MNNSIICFTASYPYGEREVYFETELDFLANKFQFIYIIPLYNPTGKSEIRKVPKNVQVYPCLVKQKRARILEGIFNLSPISFSLIKEFFSKKIYRNRNRVLNWINTLIVYRTSYFKLKTILKNLPEEAILYSYWASVPIFTSFLLENRKKIVRMHGGDFYLERNHNYLPLRKEIYEKASLLLPISKDIETILYHSYGISKNKIEVNCLGVKNCSSGMNQVENIPEEIILVSCSNLVSLKRVALIPNILRKIKKPITWIHFGDGPEMQNLKRNCHDLPVNVKIELKGWVSTEKLMQFYEDTHVTWFINISEYEGIPVSIMEAFSFGIPAIATDVGGSSEIVNHKTGHLISKDFDFEEVATFLTQFNLEKYNSMKTEAYSKWLTKFNAITNYERTTELLSNL